MQEDKRNAGRPEQWSKSDSGERARLLLSYTPSHLHSSTPPLFHTSTPEMPADGLRDLLPRTTKSPEETMKLGERLAGLFRPGDIVGLYGDLGAGKTHLVKGIAAALGIPEAGVTSPTFTLMNEYAGPSFEVYHFDAYRIKSTDEFYELGFEDYFFGDGLCLIEWPEKV